MASSTIGAPKLAASSFHIAADPDVVELSNDEILRYSRHLIMPEVTIEGQKKLKAAKVLCVGTGALGSPISMYLAAAGVGTLGLVDFDVVDFTNLQRQIAHRTESVGQPKLDSAAATLASINPNINIVKHNLMITSENALDLMRGYDIIVDGTDNFPTRYLINDACVLLGKPNVYGSIFRFEGQMTIFYAKDGPCYRCLYPEPPPPGMVPSCAEGGVFGVLPGVIGCLQAVETIKLILGAGQSMVGRLALFNAMALSFKELKLRKDPACPICGEHPTIDHLIDYDVFCGIAPSQLNNASAADIHEITPRELKERLDNHEKLTVIDVREPYEYAIAKLPDTKLVPLASLPERLHEFDTADEIVLHCKSGKRSAEAYRTMERAGFKKLLNLKGGITAWSSDVDPSVPTY